MKSKGNRTFLRSDREGFLVTVPRALVLALGLKLGDQLEWSIDDRDTFRLKVIRGGAREIRR